MRRMADSVTVANLPDGFDLYGCYDDGLYNNVAECKTRFPNKPIVVFTVFASDNFGDCLDVETGDATSAQAPGWIGWRRKAGHLGPLIYCSESLWATVRAQFMAQNVPEPGYIVAGYPGSAGPAGMYPPPAVGHQWIDRGPYDESVMVDYLPGIDPVPVPIPIPPPTDYPGDNVKATPINVPVGADGNGWVPSPVPAAQVINVTIDDTNPEAIGGYTSLPSFTGVATQTSPHAPNGALVFKGPVGNFGAVVWSTG